MGLAFGVGRNAYSGFLTTYVLHEELDADADGRPDESDFDDDNDGLRDDQELTGSLFDPATPSDIFSADSDGDGADDSEEFVAGTNPTDSQSVLRITDLAYASSGDEVTWRSRKDYTYRLLWGASPIALVETPTLVTSVIARQGIGPWQEGFLSVTNLSFATTRFYRVQIRP